MPTTATWSYQGRVITSISDMPEGTYGFIYEVRYKPTDVRYIGKKVLYFNRKVKLTKKDLTLYEGTKGRKPSYKQVVKESDWKTYWGSNKVLTNLLENEPVENFKREILTLAPNKKLLTYEETKAQFIYEVLENPNDFFNDNILGKFFTKDFESQK